MTDKGKRFPDDRTEAQRRKNLSEQQIKDLELAGGVEGGMQAGSAGGPGEKEAQSKKRFAKAPADDGGQREGR